MKIKAINYFRQVEGLLFAKVDLHDYKGNARVIGIDGAISLVLLGRNQYEMPILTSEIEFFFDKDKKQLNRDEILKKYN